MKANYRPPKEYSRLPESQQKVINNFIEKEVNRIVEERLTEERAYAIDYGIDCTLMSVLLELIETEGWGTNEKYMRRGSESRIKRLLVGVTDRISNDVERYDDSYMFALQYKLKLHGCEYVVSRLKDRKTRGTDNG